MTIPSTTSAASIPGTGTTATYPFTWSTSAPNDLVLFEQLVATGAITPLTLNVDYTVNPSVGAAPTTGGTITLTAGNLPIGVNLFICSDPSQVQAVLLQQGGPINQAAIMAGLDYITRCVQANRRVANNGMQIPLAESLAGLITTLPPAPQRALKYAGWDALGNVIAAAPPITGTTVSAAMATVVAAGTLTAAAALFGVEQQVLNIAALRLVTVPTLAGILIATAGYYVNHDGGGGLYAWDAADTTADNGLNHIQITGVSTGRWVLQNNSVWNVRQAGAYGDGIHTDTTAFTTCIAQLAISGGKVFVPSGTYIVGTLQMPNYPAPFVIEGADKLTTILTPAALNQPIFQGASTVTVNYAEQLNTVKNFTLTAHASGSTGAAVDCRNCTYTNFSEIAFQPNANTTGQWTYGFYLFAGSGPTISCYNNRFDGIYTLDNTAVSSALFSFGGTANLHHIKRIIMVGVATPMAISCASAAGMYSIFIDDSHFEGLHSSSPSVISVGTGNFDIHVRACYFEDVVKAFDETATSTCSITDCTFAPSPGTSQPTALGANYQRLNCVTGGTNLGNAIYGNLNIYYNNVITVYDPTGAAAYSITFDTVKISINYPIKLAQGLGIYGATPPAQPTGFGTPTNLGRVASFPGTAATLAQCGGQIADLITILKNMGIVGT